MSDRLPSRRAFVTAAGLLASGAVPRVAGQSGLGASSAADIIEWVTRAYAECATYQNTGSVERTIIDGDGSRWTRSLPFSTAFVRPARFRFEFFEPRGIRLLIAADGGRGRTWWDVRPGIREDILNIALAGATGVSGRAAHTVPALLMPELIYGIRLSNLTELRWLDDARLGDDSDCSRIEGSRIANRDLESRECFRQETLRVTGADVGAVAASPAVFWIDRSTLLLRRIDRQSTHDNFCSESTTIYQPLRNGEVSENQFAFDSPSR